MNVLGIGLSHDSGAALVRDGLLVAAANEERFNRVKSSPAVPLRSIDAVLSVGGCSAADIDAIAVAGLSHRGEPPLTNDFRRANGSNWDVALIEWLDRIRITPFILGTTWGVTLLNALRGSMPHIGIPEIFDHLKSRGLRPQTPLHYLDHHVAHLASAYFTSGFDECLVISNDGFGDGYCFRAAVFDNGAMTPIAALSMFHSLGNYYNYATELCGFRKYYHGGKTTGLAAFGSSEVTGPIFLGELDLNPKTGLYRNRGRLFGNEIRRLRRLLGNAPREDIAAGAQLLVESRGVSVGRTLLAETRQPRLAVAGGVHANVKLNQRLAALDEVESFFVHPHMGDGGLAVGAAFFSWAGTRPKREASSYRLPHVYLGPTIEDLAALAALTARSVSAHQCDDRELAEIATMLLCEKWVVAVARGPMEYGPRALCNRTILAHATDATLNESLNHRLRRTEFMPFAPVIREEDAAEFFVGYSSRTAHTAEFMTITYDCTDRCRRESPAVVHVDGTARPQVVRSPVNPFVHEVLTRYRQETGLSILINTSFNMHEEPIVATAEDAVAAFLTGSLDALIVGNVVAIHPSRGATGEILRSMQARHR